MFRHLIWKEWRESLWKLGFCLATSLAFTLLLLRSRIFTDMATCRGLCLILTFVVPVVYGLDLFAGEMSQRTVHLLFKLPVPRWQIYAGKILVAFLGLVLVFGGTGLVMELVARGRETDPGMLLRVAALSGLCAAGILAWFSVLGCQNRSEAASLVALAGVMVGWGVVFFWATICEVGWAGHVSPYIFLLWAVGTPPTWFSVPQLLAAQTLTLALALALGAHRYVKIRRVL